MTVPDGDYLQVVQLGRSDSAQQCRSAHRVPAHIAEGTDNASAGRGFWTSCCWDEY